MTQFFLGTNLEHLTGKSQTSNDLISCCNFEEKNKLYKHRPVWISHVIHSMHRLFESI